MAVGIVDEVVHRVGEGTGVVVVHGCSSPCLPVARATGNRLAMRAKFT